MTNSKKSYTVSAFAVLALAFCIMILGQAVIARQGPKLIRVSESQLGIPLPGSDDVAVETKAPKSDSRHTELRETLVDIAGIQPLNDGSRVERPTISASVMQGGDTFGTATVLTGPFPWSAPGVFTGTTVGYTYDYDETLCGGYTGCEDVVYSYTPPADAFLDISLCTSGGTDTKVWVIEAATMTEIQCNDDGADCPGYESHITSFGVTAGTEYYIVIGGYDDASAGPYELVLSEYTMGDDCEAPEPIADAADPADYPVVVPFDMSQSTCGMPDASGLNAGSWYFTFTADRPGLFTFSICDDGTTANTGYFGMGGGAICGVGAVCWSYGYGTTCSGIPEAGPGDGPYFCQTVMLAGWTYTFEIFDWCDGMKGNVEVTWVDLYALNDDCADAEDLGVGSFAEPMFVHNVQATVDGPGIDWCNVADPSEICADVWYTWEADAAGFALFDLCDTDADYKMMVYDGAECLDVNPREINPLGCTDDGCGEGGAGGMVEIPCVAGDQFLIRIGGWYIEGDPDYGVCANSGMGTGYLDIQINATSIRPWNDNCGAVTPVLQADGVTDRHVGSFVNAGRGDCPSDGGAYWSMTTWEAFALDACANVQMDFCGTYDVDGRYNFNNWPPEILTGCPCMGPFVFIYPTTGYWINCPEEDAAHNFNRVWELSSLIPGEYFVPVNRRLGGLSHYFDDYTINFTPTYIECEYCEAFANINSCPPVAGASWIDGVTFETISTSGTGCNSYEDHTVDQPAAPVYRGLPYDLTVVMGKTGVAGVHDSCNAWIDWNQNSGLMASGAELNEGYQLSRLALTWTATVTPPLDAALPGEGATGVTLMRVRMASDADGTNAPCGEKVWGEVEDFLLEVKALECGDFDISGTLDASDITFLRDWYFGGGVAPDYWQRADIDGDGVITIADIIALVDAAYHGGATVCL